ncbi:MAG: S53 family peptidase [Candidatus Dormiibacterota bacterium]
MPDSVPLRGSAYHPGGSTRPGHRHLRKLSAEELQADAGVTLMLRERTTGPTTAESLAWLQSLPDTSMRHLDIVQLNARHGFDAADRDRVVRWATAAGLEVTGEDPTTRRVMLRGSTAQLSRAFEVELERFGWVRPDGRTVEYRGHLGPVRLPAHLDRVVEGVYGLDDRPLARSHVRGLDDGRSAVFSYDPPQIASLYDFPRLPNGGEGLELVAAMIELGGVVHPFDLAASFARLGLNAPDITNVWLDGATPSPDPDGADVEVALDYQVIGSIVAAMAPKAHLTIVSYNAPNSERGFIDAAATAASDAIRHPAAVSISWGAPEDHWSPQGMRGLDAAFATGALHGVTFSAAAGDAGSTNAEVDGYQHPEFPASSPHAWACGGTTLLAARGRIRAETVWNELSRGAGAAGSGVSTVFPIPSYQAALGIRPRSADGAALGRGLPDGAGNADPLTGWNVVALRRLRSTGGTSAVAPMYTALWTLVSAQLGHRIGLPHPALYARRGRGFNDITSGDTGGPYRAGRGWDLASGWGSPDGRQIARDLGVRVQGPDARRPRIGGGDREIA